ncbi:hypothetical protein KIF24_24210 [Micromonospora sp. Llam7]|uniref:hypothetical protein n=1 Tax=Micromonospora tarapacensis TaxID=2835305 RepID=UPI001C831CAF|nr:hypothetical protein [Micromonospora tarapacensis]MBX7268817.1 hypothetical protein [Micromonospora tarapacensis]
MTVTDYYLLLAIHGVTLALLTAEPFVAFLRACAVEGRAIQAALRRAEQQPTNLPALVGEPPDLESGDPAWTT